MKARTISVVALLAVLCIASFVLWNFTKVAAKAATDSGSTITSGAATNRTVTSATDSQTRTGDLSAGDVILAVNEIPAASKIELCEAVLPGNTITDPAIRQLGPNSLYWINELYQGETGHLFLPSDYRQTFNNVPSTFAYLKRFNEALAARNIQLAIFILPPRAMIYQESLQSTPRPYPFDVGYENYLAGLQNLRDIGIVAPDLATPFIELAKTDSVYFRRDHHWTAEAAREAAKALAADLQENEIYQAIPKQSYVTSLADVGVLDDSTYMLRVEAVCGIEIEDEPINLYATELVLDETDAETSSGLSSSLFDEAPKIPVVLAGTSHSAKEVFNVAGFMQEALSADVVNVSVEAGGPYPSLLQFFSDSELRSTINEPSILVWEREFQGSFIPNFEKDLRQLTPSLSGICSDEEAVAMRRIEATGGTSLGMAVPPDISGTDFYLSAEIDDLSIRLPTVNMHYTGGKQESLVLGNPRIRPDTYFAEVFSAEAGELNNLFMTFPKDVFGMITLKICRAN